MDVWVKKTTILVQFFFSSSWAAVSLAEQNFAQACVDNTLS